MPTEEPRLLIADLVAIAGQRRWAITAIVLVVAIPIAAAAFLMTPTYRSEILVAYVSDEDTSEGLASYVGQLGGLGALAGVSGSDGKNEAIARLKSRAFSTEFIQQQNMFPDLFPEDWDIDKDDWGVSAEKVPTLNDAFEVFDNDFRSINEDKLTGLFTIAMEGKDPEKVAHWANQLIEQANKRLRQQAIDEANRNIRFLAEAVEKTSVVELKQVIYRVIETQIKKATLANTREEYAFKVIDPAVPSDTDDFVRPKRLLMVLLGFLLGLTLGVVYALMRHHLQVVRPE